MHQRRGDAQPGIPCAARTVGGQPPSKHTGRLSVHVPRLSVMDPHYVKIINMKNVYSDALIKDLLTRLGTYRHRSG